MSLPHPILAAYNAKDFGQGASNLAAVESALVMFMLGLLLGVLGMTAFFVYLAKRQREEELFPREAESLLEESEWEAHQREEPVIKPTKEPKEEAEEDHPNRPWERDADWWRGEED